MQTDKSIKKSISFPPALCSSAEKKAAKQHAGNLSRYIQALIEKDLADKANATDALSDTILFDLCRTLCGDITSSDLQKRTGTIDQPRALKNLIENIASGAVPIELLTSRVTPIHSAHRQRPDPPSLPSVG